MGEKQNTNNYLASNYKIGVLVAHIWNNQEKIMSFRSLVQCTIVVSAKSAKV